MSVGGMTACAARCGFDMGRRNQRRTAVRMAHHIDLDLEHRLDAFGGEHFGVGYRVPATVVNAPAADTSNIVVCGSRAPLLRFKDT